MSKKNKNSNRKDNKKQTGTKNNSPDKQGQKTSNSKLNSEDYNKSEDHNKSKIETSNIHATKMNKKEKIGQFFKLLWECITYKMVLFIVIAIYVVYVFSGFKINVQKQINDNTKSYLKSMVNESLEKIRIKINDEFIVLNTMALFYDEDIDLETTENMLKDAMQTHNFDGVSFVGLNKEDIVTLGNKGNYEDDEFIDSAMKGTESISSIYLKNDNEEFISLSVPVYSDDHKILGTLVCNYNIEAFTEIIDTSSFEQFGTTIISQEDGTLVSRPESIGKNVNLFSLLDSININNEKSIEKLKKNITGGQSGIITYGSGKYKRYICYNVVPGTNWYSVSIVSANAIEPVAKKVSSLAVKFTIHISFVVVGYIMLTLAIDMKTLQKKNERVKA